MPKNRLIRSWLVRICSFEGRLFVERCQFRIVFFLAIVLILLGANPVLSQGEPEEPPPVVLPDQTPTTLADLLREYKVLGLPLPPKRARLVFANDFSERPALSAQQDQPENLELCFEVQPGRKDEPGRFLIGLETRESHAPVQELRSPVDQRIVSALFGPIAHDPNQPVQWLPWYDPELILAIQCHAEGRSDVAEFLMNRCRFRTPIPLKKRLIIIAWNHLVDQLTRSDSDRPALAKRLKEILKKYPEAATDATRPLLADLETTLKPSPKSATKVEALIDRMGNCGRDGMFRQAYLFPRDEINEERYKWDRARNEPAFDTIAQIVELGFEAIPDLIDHLDDRRLTRFRSLHQSSDEFLDGVMRVGEAARSVLNQWVDHPNRTFEGEKDLRFYQDWWQEICETGEENYLLKNLWQDNAKDNNGPYLPYLIILFHHYPDRLPSIYRNILLNRPELVSNQVAEMIAKGPYRKEEKCRLLMLGVGHARAEHRIPAIAALQMVDSKRFATVWLEAMRVHGQANIQWEQSPFCNGVAALAREVDDPEIWEVLGKVTKIAPVEHRGRFLGSLGYSYLETNTKCQIRFLMQFLDDDAVWEQRLPRRPIPNEEQFVVVIKTEIRNVAAEQLAGLWNLAGSSDAKSPEEWQKVREKVRALAQKELNEP